MKTKIYSIVFFISVLVLFSCSGRDNQMQNNDAFIVNPIDVSRLQILSPTRNESLEPGATLKIHWSFPGNINTVQIALYRKSEFKQHLSVKTENSGYFEWKIPSDIKNSVHYRIRIAVYDNPYINKFSDYFFIVKQ